MKLLEHLHAACRQQHFAKSTEQVYCRWAEEYVRYHKDRTGTWTHPGELGERDIEAFLTHLAVNRKLAASSQNQAFAALLFLPT